MCRLSSKQINGAFQSPLCQGFDEHREDWMIKQTQHPLMIQVKDYFRKNFFELVDCAVAAINSRFNTPWLDLACTVERLLMEGAALLKQVTEHYEDDMNPGRLERQLLFLSDMREASSDSVI